MDGWCGGGIVIEVSGNGWVVCGGIVIEVSGNGWVVWGGGDCD